MYDQVSKLKAQLETAQTENKKLKHENKTMRMAWRKSEHFLKDVTDGRSVEEMIHAADIGRLPKLESSCSKCQSPDISVIKFGNFRIVKCSALACGHKEKINEPKQESEE